MYSKEELEEIDKRLRKVSQDIQKEEKLFWDEEYPSKSREERIKHWASSLYRSMRSQEEVGQSAYSIYKKKWLEEVLKVEPEFMTFLPGVVKIWGGMWDHVKIEKRILKMYKQIKNSENHSQ